VGIIERFLIGGERVADIHLDSAVLAVLQDIMGDEYAVLLETFLVDSEERLRLLRHAELTADAQGLRLASHSFKGSCSNMGALTLAGLCKELEEVGLRQMLGDAPGLLEQIEREFAIVRILCKSELQRYRV
jgi:HPt (histidine-containing phosphotransfer) domain-containing protein